MTTDEQVVQEADLALVAATRNFLNASMQDRAQIRPYLEKARKSWADARYRLLFPDSITTQADAYAAKALRQRIEQSANKQTLVQALLDLAGLLIKFAH